MKCIFFTFHGAYSAYIYIYIYNIQDLQPIEDQGLSTSADRPEV